LKKKIADNALTLANADKGNSIEILTEPDYNQKVLTFLTQNCADLTQFNFNTNNSGVGKRICDSNYVIQNEKTKNFLYVMNPSPPKLYGHIKTHKNNFPIKPVVSYFTSPAYNLCWFLNNWFRSH